MSTDRFGAWAWFALSWVVVAGLPGPASADATAFVGVDVVSVEAGGLLEDQTVLVEEGAIVAVGPTASVALPDGVTKIDGTGKYLHYGLTDVHVHFATDGFISALLGKETKLKPVEDMLYLYVANGVTTVRVMAGFPELLELRERIARGAVLGPRLIVSTPMFDGEKPIWPAPLGMPITSPEEARTAVRECKAAGYDLIKVYSLIQRDAYDAMMDEAGKVGLKVVGHVPVFVGQEHVFASGQHEITHVEEFWRFTEDYGDEVVERFTRMIADAGTWFSPTLSTYTNIARQFEDMDAMLAQDELRYVDPAVVEFWAPPNNRFLGANEDPKQAKQALEAFRPLAGFMMRLVKSFYEAGVPLETGSDVLNPMSTPGFALHDELAELVRAGLPEIEAIRASTTRPAEFMGESDTWGAVAPGRKADLVLLSANPLEDIRNTERIDGVMVGGRWLSREAIRARLDEIAAAYSEGRSASK